MVWTKPRGTESTCWRRSCSETQCVPGTTRQPVLAPHPGEPTMPPPARREVWEARWGRRAAPALPAWLSLGLHWTSSTHSAGNHPMCPRALPSQKPPSPMLRTRDKDKDGVRGRGQARGGGGLAGGGGQRRERGHHVGGQACQLTTL